MKTEQITIFNVYPGINNIQASAIMNKETFEYEKIKLISYVPRGQYYSVLNDAMHVISERSQEYREYLNNKFGVVLSNEII